jgi:hypothetical protein
MKTAVPASDPAQPGPLADLLRHIEQSRLQGAGTPAADGTAGAAVTAGAISAAVGPGDLRYFRSTWSRLRIDRQLTQSQAQVPENAGPLHSDRLVLRALQTLRELSPAYLNRYMAYVDTLMGLEQARASLPAAPANTAPAADSQRKPARGKAGRAGKAVSSAGSARKG